MATYSTPGVYIEEIAKFPPSVAQVETAIPAFLGYTEKATNKTEGDLSEIPTRISSMLEYETYFGFALAEQGMVVDVNDDVISVRSLTSPSPFLMYYSLQLYFANGGGPCYIVSVGQYGEGTSPATTVALGSDTTEGLAKGLKLLEKEDEPTLILFPDATSLTGGSTDFYSLYNLALTQCNKLQDRFAIIDTFSYDNSNPVDANIAGLRNGINLGKDFVKYGAAYYPFVETILDYNYKDADVTVNVSDSAGTTPAQQVQSISDGINTTSLTQLITDMVGLRNDVDAAADDTAALAIKPSVESKLQEIISFVTATQQALSDAETIGTADAATEAAALGAWSNIDSLDTDLNTRLTKLQADDTKTKIMNTISEATNTVYDDLGVNAATPADSTTVTDLTTLKSSGELSALITALGAASSSVTTSNLDALEGTDNALFNRVKAEIGQVPVILPPSSGMAGVYARTDNTRGVWKAPANVGMSYVIKPTVHISHEEQEDLNIHGTGKSINAIRTFAGKGTLVWGARTLAGNDNEWRYVSVRRFFNFAEESIKKATEQFVFEPNDANTWVKVKAMITNFLNLQWRAGALAGPTPDKAFYVNVGLGETMTAQDILEGNMFVEIGMAVVRPAEFIILKFSHKMQEA
ncbi:phage tail sheath subtilisin-like domain-containing protein [Aquimarina sp. ERC-38]|uniref:phage tail sheath family protein n=1 Tax=Aquimarina sp. ERC-38 TaxID=2949996 RepID=UPI002246929E|nr:phage tail sheath C-terminal domain-containing protein [Aquimarina sp. ERC-38]UZO81766.1 phage tail sheath subtilisin-like domain-containing protein [Aquimarina sp. ERC-38]